jgi:hypothetical protein
LSDKKNHLEEPTLPDCQAETPHRACPYSLRLTFILVEFGLRYVGNMIANALRFAKPMAIATPAANFSVISGIPPSHFSPSDCLKTRWRLQIAATTTQSRPASAGF